jgi:hypothetical protein
VGQFWRAPKSTAQTKGRFSGTTRWLHWLGSRRDASFIREVRKEARPGPAVAYNRAQFCRAGVDFQYGNMIEDELPDADLCLIRQVLQHFSNSQILRVLSKCTKYRFVLVTEEVYMGSRCQPNRDKPHGPDYRLYDRSGVYLDRPPFNQHAKSVLELRASPKSVMRTSLIESSRL